MHSSFGQGHKKLAPRSASKSLSVRTHKRLGNALPSPTSAPSFGAVGEHDESVNTTPPTQNHLFSSDPPKRHDLLSVWGSCQAGINRKKSSCRRPGGVAFTTSIYHGISTSRKASEVQPPHRRFRSPRIRGRSEASPETLRKQQPPPRPFPPLSLLFTVSRPVCH